MSVSALQVWVVTRQVCCPSLPDCPSCPERTTTAPLSDQAEAHLAPILCGSNPFPDRIGWFWDHPITRDCSSIHVQRLPTPDLSLGRESREISHQTEQRLDSVQSAPKPWPGL